MATKEATCAERIAGQLESLEADCAEVLAGYFSGDEEKFDEWNNFPLAVSTRQETKIELSWGGPSSFLIVSHDQGEVLGVVFHFLDWFDGASVPVSKDSQVWAYAVSVIEAREGM